MRIRDLLAIGGLPVRLLSDAAHLDRSFTGVHITDLPDPGRYLTGGELVLTGLTWRRTPGDSARFVAALAGARVAALGAGRALLGHVPDDLADACREYDLPLIDVPTEVSFRALAGLVETRLASAGAAGLRGALGRQRRIVAAVAEGGGLPALVELTSGELGVPAAVISASGTVVAGRLPAATARRLAGEWLAAPRLPHLVATEERAYTLFAVDRSHRAAGWALALGADVLDRADAGFEAAACAAMERARLEEGRRVERRLAAELVELAGSGMADPAELAARLRTCGVGPDEPYVVLAATADDPGAGVAGSAALGGQVLEEVLDRRVVAAVSPDVALALVPLRPPAGSPEDDHAAEVAKRHRNRIDPWSRPAVRSTVQMQAQPQVQRSVRALLDLLGDRVPGLQTALPGLRLSVGVSGAATGSGGIRGGAEEAGHARRLAEARGGGVVTSDEIYTHDLLLATVPDTVRRSFTERILNPLVEYDRRHRSELVRTLGTFLDCSGSWNLCAERLHVHVNTVRYRISRIEELTGKRLGSMADRVDLYLALRAG
ncbi:hypothetical protein Sru01_09160 [Sphaerisporangium rufum]|uniref:PucR family transcriptional regulator n=1 Tax=Sphaerisporangium rufum TaxID=1381558 RepID=A0A919QXK0_9ACTN|nr:PucR family transcriptional regulator [Sphaerisporangium rufum]GII75934.1 hypothetical protein Sru01_09160 [Sphaerisporangium rufum]